MIPYGGNVGGRTGGEDRETAYLKSAQSNMATESRSQYENVCMEMYWIDLCIRG